MSTTGPMTRAMRPVPAEPAWAAFSVTVAVMSVSLSALGSGGGQRVGSADDLADLLGDLGLAGLVGQPGVQADEVGRVVGRRLHGALPGGLLAGRGLQQAVEDAAADVARQQRVEDGLDAGLELVQGQDLVILRLLL